MTLNDALNDYINSQIVRSKDTTLKTASSHVKKLREWFPSSGPNVTPGKIDLFVEKMRFEGLADTTINGVLRVLRAALKLAEENGKIEKAPKVRLLRETKKIPSVLTGEEVERLASAALGRTNLAILFAAFAGLRRAEILHLTWGDIDFGLEGQGLVRVAAKDGWTPKSHAERIVPIPERLRSAVYREFNGPPWNGAHTEHARIFTDVDLDLAVSAFKRAGLYDPDTKPGLHMLRRTFASRLLQKGVDIETVRELGGWADLKTVQAYLASTNDLKRAAVAALEENDG
jgi:integrase